MKRNIIEMTEHGTVTIPSEAIWMSEAELVVLFGVIAPTIRASIKAIYKSGILKEYEAQRYIRLSDKVCIDVYSLEMVIAIAFRICSKESILFRRFVINEISSTKRETPITLFVSCGRGGNRWYS